MFQKHMAIAEESTPAILQSPQKNQRTYRRTSQSQWSQIKRNYNVTDHSCGLINLRGKIIYMHCACCSIQCMYSYILEKKNQNQKIRNNVKTRCCH